MTTRIREALELEIAPSRQRSSIAKDLNAIEELVSELCGIHHRICPRQVLGVRIGLYAGHLLALDLPREDKRLLAFVETDGCFLDGVIAATGCAVGRRTMRVLDYGKVAGTFVDIERGESVRIAPRLGVRDAAGEYAPDARDRWTAQLQGYQIMPAGELLAAEPVQLTLDLKAIISRPGVRVNCEVCGEEIINAREVHRDGAVLCRHCDGDIYFRSLPDSPASRAIETFNLGTSN